MLVGELKEFKWFVWELWKFIIFNKKLQITALYDTILPFHQIILKKFIDPYLFRLHRQIQIKHYERLIVNTSNLIDDLLQ